VARRLASLKRALPVKLPLLSRQNLISGEYVSNEVDLLVVYGGQRNEEIPPMSCEVNPGRGNLISPIRCGYWARRPPWLRRSGTCGQRYGRGDV